MYNGLSRTVYGAVGASWSLPVTLCVCRTLSLEFNPSIYLSIADLGGESQKRKRGGKALGKMLCCVYLTLVSSGKGAGMRLWDQKMKVWNKIPLHAALRSFFPPSSLLVPYRTGSRSTEKNSQCTQRATH